MTNPKHYPSSAPGRIAEFFRDNPTEEGLLERVSIVRLKCKMTQPIACARAHFTEE